MIHALASDLFSFVVPNGVSIGPTDGAVGAAVVRTLPPLGTLYVLSLKGLVSNVIVHGPPPSRAIHFTSCPCFTFTTSVENDTRH